MRDQDREDLLARTLSNPLARLTNPAAMQAPRATWVKRVGGDAGKATEARSRILKAGRHKRHDYQISEDRGLDAPRSPICLPPAGPDLFFDKSTDRKIAGHICLPASGRTCGVEELRTVDRTERRKPRCPTPLFAAKMLSDFASGLSPTYIALNPLHPTPKRYPLNPPPQGPPAP